MEILNVYEVVINSDPNEGKGTNYVCARFMSNQEALKFARGRDVCGSNGSVQRGKVLVVGGEGGSFSYYPINAAVKVYGTVEDEAREEALKKLTLEERKLLGLI